MTQQAPIWKRVFDAVERPVADRLERAVRSDAGMGAIATTAKAAGRLPRGPQQLSPPDGAVRWLGSELDKGMHRLRNGIRVLADVDPPKFDGTPSEEIWAEGRARLLRFESNQRSGGPPVVIVPSLVTTAALFDLQAKTSAVRYLLQAGFDVNLLDWGVADARDARNDLSTYVDGYLPGAIAAACDAAGAGQAHVLGHCFGGVLALLHAATQPERVRSLAVMATPVDWRTMGPLAELTKEGRLDVVDLTDRTGNVPASTIKNAFRVIQPTAQLSGITNLLQHLDNDAYVENYRVIADWSSDHVPFPGRCFGEMVELLVRSNSLTEGTTKIGERVVDLHDIKVPLLVVACDNDHIVPPAAALPLADLVSSVVVETVNIPAGHIGLLIGRSAFTHTLPALQAWWGRDGA